MLLRSPKLGWGHGRATGPAGPWQGCQRRVGLCASSCRRCREAGGAPVGARGSVALLTHWRGVGIGGGRHTGTRSGNTARTPAAGPPTLPQPRGTEGTGAGHSTATATSPRRGTGSRLDTTSSLGARSGMGWDSHGAAPAPRGG